MLSIEEIKRVVTPIFESHGVTKAILFGSYVKGEATEDSDIDLVVETEDYVRGFAFFGIAADVEDVLSKEVDLICGRNIVPDSRIDREVRATGRVIYEKVG